MLAVATVAATDLSTVEGSLFSRKPLAYHFSFVREGEVGSGLGVAGPGACGGSAS